MGTRSMVHRNRWQALTDVGRWSLGFSMGATLSFALLIALLACLGPRIGAAEGERVLSLGPLWIRELVYVTDGAGWHSWTVRTNLAFVGVVSAFGGLLWAGIFGRKPKARVQLNRYGS